MHADYDYGIPGYHGLDWDVFGQMDSSMICSTQLNFKVYEEIQKLPEHDSTFDFVRSTQSMNFWWQIVILLTQRTVLSFLAGSNSKASNTESRGIKQICTAFLLMGQLIAPSSCPQFLLPHLVFIISILKNSLFGSSIFIVLWF